MQTRQRREQVLMVLKERRRVTIEGLAKDLEVSTMTIRRDLRRLADEDIVTLVHGGAVYNEGGAYLPALTVREKTMRREKSAIAEYCAQQIPEGSAVYLDNGSTTVEIADALRGKQNIAVLSHSLPVLNILSHAKNIQLISVSGIYEPRAKGFFGDLALRMLRQFRIDIAFLGVTAVDAEDGVMSAVFYEQALKKVLVERAKKKILAIDHTKIGGSSFLKVCDLHEIDGIVTDKFADATFIAKAKRMGIEVAQV
ncbi:MAG: DeoR/GlpR family DNA-binding transcription regulator [Selenomonadaceae bacterium]|uniref:DeoR/GlpR transcriptional regulator n=1 Tax=Selenomonas bovis TaxID=416586 RepID=A0A848B1F9_9FIRM|nr:DeoR/GlpR family DNA-binding transcription regulator [Selenomonas bovis]MBQ1622745.1 DeoR/GlpR transcriptional regulator [Selenomonas sp.]MDY6271885.1 DeoR/GlpR family DNA-binding transcription regulator [Selenomonadaceae bacterium]MCI6172238.1 DeoR/GlpR family DNA-binding transcription regulator [Selenomonas bovis]MDY6300074.1 DeoR/GlpR family DNA-binding transcription regulator [Selenomonadaceae bacterium]NMD98039.1 DeoR/GlpR transcriptional regulator [Selenomonas bovis]